MSTLAPEREAEIRKWAERNDIYNFARGFVLELLSALDAAREERDLWKRTADFWIETAEAVEKAGDFLYEQLGTVFASTDQFNSNSMMHACDGWLEARVLSGGSERKPPAKIRHDWNAAGIAKPPKGFLSGGSE